MMRQSGRRQLIVAAFCWLAALNAASGWTAEPHAAAPGAVRIGDCDCWEQFFDTFPMRAPVLLMVENDPEVIDVDYWLDLFRRTHADAVTLAAGGYMAFYPSKVPHHYRSPYLKPGQDLFGTLAAGCRKLGMKYIFARTDGHAIHKSVAAAKPEWVAVDAAGRQRKHPNDADAYLTCVLGPFSRELMNEVHKEIIRDYDVDFIFCNRWDGMGICYCGRCREQYQKDTGREMPPTPDDPLVRWHREKVAELAAFWNREIQKIKPGARFIPNSVCGPTAPMPGPELAAMVPFLIADRKARPNGDAIWRNGVYAKEFRAVLGRKPVLAGVNVGVGDNRFRWMDSTREPAELLLWYAEGIANGMVPRFTKHSGVVYNSVWEKPVVELFTWLHANERYLRNVAPIADVAVVYSQQTACNYGKSNVGERVLAHLDGFYQALLESRIPFELIHDELLDEERLKDFRTLVLPNIAALSDRQCEQIRAFVRRGGNIVATHETSLYDESGRRRNDFGLADLFGASAAGQEEGPIQNAYLNVEPGRNGVFHPLVRGLEEHRRIVYGGYRVPIWPTGPLVANPLTYVPPYPSLPMEQLYPRTPRTNLPEAIIRETEGGRVVYFPWDLSRVFRECQQKDHLALLRNAVEWANGRPSPAVVAGKGLVDVTVWRQKQSMTVHLVNLTNPMAMAGNIREIYPIGPLEVQVRLPVGTRAAAVRLLKAGKEIEAVKTPDGLRATVPNVEIHEVLAIDLEPLE